jgi:hypothetical protein
MVHPEGPYEKDGKIILIEVNLEICTLYKGVPHGPAIITHTDEKNKYKSFHGVGIF